MTRNTSGLLVVLGDEYLGLDWIYTRYTVCGVKWDNSFTSVMYLYVGFAPVFAPDGLDTFLLERGACRVPDLWRKGG